MGNNYEFLTLLVTIFALFLALIDMLVFTDKENVNKTHIIRLIFLNAIILSGLTVLAFFISLMITTNLVPTTPENLVQRTTIIAVISGIIMGIVWTTIILPNLKGWLSRHKEKLGRRQT